MNRDKIENSTVGKLPAEAIDLSEFMTAATGPQPKTGKHYVDLNGEVSPAVLAGLLDCNVSLIYQMRQNGRLPPNSDASLRDCVKHHIAFWKQKSINKVNGLQDAATVQKIQLDRARTESAWLQIKKDRSELVDVNQLATVFEPYFIQMRTQLCSLSRKHPEIQTELDKIMDDWARLGEELRAQASQELDLFIDQELNKEVEFDDESAEEDYGIELPEVPRVGDFDDL